MGCLSPPSGGYLFAGAFTLPRPLCVMGWLCTAAMAVAVVIMFVTW